MAVQFNMIIKLVSAGTSQAMGTDECAVRTFAVRSRTMLLGSCTCQNGRGV